MKIERISGSANFSDVEVGEVFMEEGGTCVYLRIEVDNDLTNAYNHDGLAVNLDTGCVTWFNDNDEVRIFPNAKVVC
jgi:hypothetical protein